MRRTSKSYPTVRPERGDVSTEAFMSESPLNRNAGPIATIAGGLFAVAAVGLFAWLVSVVLFSTGWILFGVASLRARVFRERCPSPSRSLA
jgi:hypothetical protein